MYESNVKERGRVKEGDRLKIGQEGKRDKWIKIIKTCNLCHSLFFISYNNVPLLNSLNKCCNLLYIINECLQNSAL